MIAWIDLETTGLDPNKCSIIEFACVVTNTNYKEIKSMSRLTKRGTNIYWDCTALNMHHDSGLYYDWNNLGDISITNLDLLVKRFLKNSYTDAEFKPLILGGQSVHFDRSFMERWMPNTSKCLSHRQIDVSGLKLFTSHKCGIPTEVLPPKRELTTHRALDDIRASIEAMRWYKQHLVLVDWF